METKKIGIVKLGFKEALKRFKIVSLPLSFFAVLTIGMLALGFYAPITLILTIPFIVIPSFFAVAAINTIAPNENTHEALGFFIMFRAYFSQVFRGGYKVIIGLLKALLVSLLISTILTAILTSTVISKDPSYIELISITDPNQFAEAFNNFVANNKTFNNVMEITYMCSSFGFFFMCIHHFAVHSFKYNYNFLSAIPLPMHDLNIINKEVMKKHRWSYLKEHYKAFWFIGLILLLGFAGGELLAYFVMQDINVAQIPVVGLFFALILGLFFIPYFLNASQQIFVNYRPLYVDTLIDLTKKSLEEMKKANQISEDKEKEVLKVIESQKVNNENPDKDKDSN